MQHRLAMRVNANQSLAATAMAVVVAPARWVLLLLLLLLLPLLLQWVMSLGSPDSTWLTMQGLGQLLLRRKCVPRAVTQ